MGDLEEFGYVPKSSCGQSLCRPNFSSYDDFQEKMNLLSARLLEQAKVQYDRAKCHPYVQEHVTPRV